MNSLTFLWHQKIKNRTEIKVNGKLHCTTGPAVFTEDGNYIEFWIDGKKSRLEGPAITDNYLGIREWWVDGKRDRKDGPAIERFNGLLTKPKETHVNEYWVDGRRSDIEKDLSEVEFSLKTHTHTENLLKDLLKKAQTKKERKLVTIAQRRLRGEDNEDELELETILT